MASTSLPTLLLVFLGICIVLTSAQDDSGEYGGFSEGGEGEQGGFDYGGGGGGEANSEGDYEGGGSEESNPQPVRHPMRFKRSERVRRSGHHGHVGPVKTYVKTDHDANFKWGAKHLVGSKYGGNGHD